MPWLLLAVPGLAVGWFAYGRFSRWLEHRHAAMVSTALATPVPEPRPRDWDHELREFLEEVGD